MHRSGSMLNIRCIFKALGHTLGPEKIKTLRAPAVGDEGGIELVVGFQELLHQALLADHWDELHYPVLHALTHGVQLLLADKDRRADRRVCASRGHGSHPPREQTELAASDLEQFCVCWAGPIWLQLAHQRRHQRQVSLGRVQLSSQLLHLRFRIYTRNASQSCVHWCFYTISTGSRLGPIFC